MLGKLKEKVRLSSKKKRKYARGKVEDRVCISVLKGYKPGAEKFEFDSCFSTRIFDMSAGGICIGHPDTLTSSVYVMVNSSNNLRKRECLDCPRFDIISKNFTKEHIIGKVAWRTSKRAGIEFTEVSSSDRRNLDNRAKSIF